MILRICFVLFVATCTVNCKKNVPFDDETLKEIFGSQAQASDVVSHQVTTKAPLAQVTPVVPSGTQNTQDDDYWDESAAYKPPSAAVADYDQFDWILTKRVASSSEKNFLMSPLGLKLALTVLMEASSQATKNELTFVLGLSTDRNATRKKFSSIIASLKTGSKDYDLSLGSRIYLESHIIPTQRFAAIAADHYNTELKQINFQEPLVASKTINSWVSEVTRGKITDLVDPDDVNSIVMMLINTLYFKGTWLHQFSVNDTKDDFFYISEKQKKPIPFMNVKNRFHFVESTRLDAKILRMPYLGDNKFAMYIIVPNSHTGLSRVMEDLDSLRVDLDAMREIFVDVTIPKFKFDYTSHLDTLLKSMGVREIFEDTASLPGISRGAGLSHKLKVSKVLQRSGIEVNELGSIAYTATEFTLVNKFGEDEAQVIANRPFFFFIQDEGTRQLLFTGRVVDPESLDGAFKLA